MIRRRPVPSQSLLGLGGTSSPGLLDMAADYLYPQGWGGGILGLGNPAMDHYKSTAARIDPNSAYNLELKKRGSNLTMLDAMLNRSGEVNPGEFMGPGGFVGMVKAALPKTAGITGTALLDKMPVAARAVPEKAYSIADKIKARIPDADIRVEDWGTGVGQSSYIKIYAKEPADTYAARVKAWEAAKGTKRGPEPRQKVISTSVRVSDHSVGPKRYNEHSGHFRPDSTDDEISSWLEKLSASVPWVPTR